eukprot:TRINITY_DN17979_c0_g1_i1.p1 TRINITY_DN17979_c0_g1~~TRINITY_DN17979_c0_g1_i1.p1  ORF type:complete len:416 (+),score=101.60 TRINITY_DN17979_c0_g1_i1:92-1339(+)
MAAAGDAAAAPPAFNVGDLVVAHGLQQDPSLNGCTGTVVGQPGDRFAVDFGSRGTKLLKRANLRAAPPADADSILEDALAEVAPAPPASLDEGLRMQLSGDVESALAGKMEALGKPRELAEFVCAICSDHTFGDPVSAACDAGHPFHEVCIKQWLAQGKRECPVCRQSLPVDGKPFKPVQAFVRSTINRAEVQCPQKCGTRLPFEQLRTHITAACKHTKFVCANQGCGAHGSREHLALHVPKCPHKPVPCSLCKEMVSPGNLQVHVETACPQRQVDCKRCHARITACDEEDHDKGCSGAVTMSDLGALKELVLQQARQMEQLREELRSTRAQVEAIFGVPLTQVNIDLRSASHPRLSGRYTLLPVRHNGFPVWGVDHRKIYRTSAFWIVTDNCLNEMSADRGWVPDPSTSSAAAE